MTRRCVSRHRLHSLARVVLGVLLTLVAIPLRAQAPAPSNPGQLIVKVNQPGPAISPTLYGLMTEEINHSYDGGLYGELIRNRIFRDDPDRPVHWSLITEGAGAGEIALDKSQPVNTTALTTSLRLSITGATLGQRVGIANDGYWGIPVKPHTRYQASFYARSANGFSGPLTLDLESSDGKTIYASARVRRIGPVWKQYHAALRTGDAAPSTANRFVISATVPGTVWFNLVSLFPPTFNHRANGNRIDLMQKLAAMHPAFLRLPGGNYLEGNTIADRFEWKDTVGPLSQRPGHRGPWGYRSSDGMGLLEFLEWCEDLHIQPVLAVFAGYALDGEHVAAGPGLQPYVQDALDEIQYVTGPTNTPWGARRARDGHPRPFPLEYVEIGNEDTFDRSGSYDGRYAQFFDAIRAIYPTLKVIATRSVRSRKPDLVDEHFYRSAAAMERDAHHYDTYSRTGPKIFVGEWASTEGRPTPIFDAALGDAAWLTGLERNSDLVTISSYAPLLVNVNPGASQWGTNLIGYDALTSYGSPSYYVQKMFSQNRGDVVLPVQITPQETTVPAESVPVPHGMIGVGSWNTQNEFRNLKVTHGDTVLYQSDFANGTAGWNLGQGDWSVQDGALRQSSGRTDCRATAGDPAWTDYTYTLQARKIGGSEGFLILFHAVNDNNLLWWNIGGWGNTQDGIEKIADGGKSMIGAPVDASVETGRWYNIQIEVNGPNIRCILDGKLVSTGVDRPDAGAGPLFATASGDRATGDVILKVVNVQAAPQRLEIQLQGVGAAASTATAEVLTGDPRDQNTIGAPEKIVPRTETLSVAGPVFVHEFPGHSVTVLRVHTPARF